MENSTSSSINSNKSIQERYSKRNTSKKDFMFLREWDSPSFRNVNTNGSAMISNISPLAKCIIAEGRQVGQSLGSSQSDISDVVRNSHIPIIIKNKSDKQGNNGYTHQEHNLEDDSVRSDVAVHAMEDDSVRSDAGGMSSNDTVDSITVQVSVQDVNITDETLEPEENFSPNISHQQRTGNNSISNVSTDESGHKTSLSKSSQKQKNIVISKQKQKPMKRRISSQTEVIENTQIEKEQDLRETSTDFAEGGRRGNVETFTPQIPVKKRLKEKSSSSADLQVKNRKKDKETAALTVDVWQADGHRGTTKINKLDIVLDCVMNTIETTEDNCETNAEKKAVGKFKKHMKRDITSFVQRMDDVLIAKSKKKKLKNQLTKLREELADIQKVNIGSERRQNVKTNDSEMKTWSVSSWLCDMENLLDVTAKTKAKAKDRSDTVTFGYLPVIK